MKATGVSITPSRVEVSFGLFDHGYAYFRSKSTSAKGVSTYHFTIYPKSIDDIGDILVLLELYGATTSHIAYNYMYVSVPEDKMDVFKIKRRQAATCEGV